MKNRKNLSLLLAGTMTAALLAVPAQAAEVPQTEPYTMVAKGDDYSAVKNLIRCMEGVLRYEHHVSQIFAPHTRELKAACGSCARAMKFLCGAADIPCFTVSSKPHTWNLVYVDGQWLHQIARSVNAGSAKAEDARRGLCLLDQVYELMSQIARK